MFYGNRVERYEFELLSKRAGGYESAGLLDNISSGRVTVDFTREIVCNATFHLDEMRGIDYLTDRIRPWYCLGDKRWPLGVYMLIEPGRIADGRTVRREVWAYDSLLALQDDLIDTSYVVDKGAHVVNTVRDLIDSVGDWLEHNIEDSDAVLRESLTWQIGTPKLEIVNRLLEAINYYPLWADGWGCFRGIPWRVEPLITWEFRDNKEGLYVPELRADIDYSEVYNKVIIVADQFNEEEPPLISVKTLEDIGLKSHPFSYSSRGRYVTLLLTSESVDQKFIDNRARKVLLEGLGVGETVSYTHAFISSRNEPDNEDGLPWHGDSYLFKNELMGLEAIYNLEAMELNLKPGELVSATIRRAVHV